MTDKYTDNHLGAKKYIVQTQYKLYKLMHLWAYTVMPGGNITKRTVEEKGPLACNLASKQRSIQHAKRCKNVCKDRQEIVSKL